MIAAHLRRQKTFTNYRFSQPGRSPYQHADMLYPGADFPFTYPIIKDTLQEDGWLPGALPYRRQLSQRSFKPTAELE